MITLHSISLRFIRSSQKFCCFIKSSVKESIYLSRTTFNALFTCCPLPLPFVLMHLSLEQMWETVLMAIVKQMVQREGETETSLTVRHIHPLESLDDAQES
uniref:Uncharacterized protein n=1 Tax=Cacopsylla melanoneura TaxID=428564 RepID=A0A8D8ZA21_9HEMI